MADKPFGLIENPSRTQIKVRVIFTKEGAMESFVLGSPHEVINITSHLSNVLHVYGALSMGD